MIQQVRHESELRPNSKPFLEDTFLLLDALEQEAEELRKERPLICLEVG